MGPSVRTSCAISIVIASALLFGCAPREEPAAAPPAVAPPVVGPPPPIPVPVPPLGRSELLDAVALETGRFATAGPYPDTVTGLAGRRFRLRLPFGCAGASDGSLGYAFDPAKRALKLTARPEVWTETPWAQTLGNGEEVEAIEGFWVRRPWLTSEDCPAQAPILPDNGASPETVGVAQVFKAEGSRLLRRAGRAYEVTRKVETDQVPGAGGFRLVLEGRVADGQGRPVRCRSGHPDQRPACLILVEIDRVAFEDAAGDMLAEWRN